MADLKMTLSDSDEEIEQPKQNVDLKPAKKRDAKQETKSTDDDMIMVDSKFTLIDDSITKDVSKIKEKREYDATKKTSVEWKFQNIVKEDGPTQTEDDVSVLRNKIIALRKLENFDELDKNLEQIYKMSGRGTDIDLDKLPETQTKTKKSGKSSLGSHAKVHYEKDDLISFHELYLSRPLVKACNSLEYDHPTRIQSQVIPNIIENKDLLVNAVTGSGKTASYLLPILEKLFRRDMRISKVSNTKLAKTRVLILQPTRELAAQCSSMLENLSKYLVPRVTYATVIGGSSIKKQEAELFDKPDIVISTPGRILDIILNSKSIYFNSIETLVLDEADKLLEMGFQQMIEEIIKNVKKDSNIENLQTLLFSATLTKDVKNLARLALRNPKMIAESKQQNSVNAYLKLTHFVISVPSANEEDDSKKKKKTEQEIIDESDSNDDSDSDQPEEAGDDKKDTKKNAKPKGEQKLGAKVRDQRLREAIVLSLCLKTYKSKVIIFMNRKQECNRLFILFGFFGLKAAQVHGNMTQKQRMISVEKFQSGEIDFLIATDLLARGLDIHNVQAVINTRFPNEESRYIHRVGRTARAGNSGTAITICDPDEKKACKKVIKKCKSKPKPFSFPPTVRDMVLTQVNLLQDHIITVMREKRAELELSRAEMEVRKAQNIIDNYEEIHNRPRKQWFQTAKQKLEDDNEKKKELDVNIVQNNAVRKKMKMIEKIKATKKKLHEDEVHHVRQEKFKRKATRKSFKPGKPTQKRQKTKESDAPKKQKKVKSKKVHGKNTMFKEEF